MCFVKHTGLQGTDYNKNITDLQSSETFQADKSVSAIKDKAANTGSGLGNSKARECLEIAEGKLLCSNLLTLNALPLKALSSSCLSQDATVDGHAVYHAEVVVLLVKTSGTVKGLGKTRAEQPLLQAACLHSRCSAWFVPTAVTL